MKSLNSILTYKNDNVVHKFVEKYNIPFEESNDIFTETLKWLWLSANGKNLLQEKIAKSSFLIIDKMWHTFLLFTKDYASFCQTNFGEFVHHVPSFNNTPTILTSYKALYKKQLLLIINNLGESTMLKWESYGTKYTKKSIHQLLKSK